MLLKEVSSTLKPKVIKPVRTKIMRRLRVPVLTAAMVLGGSLVTKAQNNVLLRDRFEQTTNVVNDTIKSNLETKLPAINDTIAYDKISDTILNLTGKISDNQSIGVQVVAEHPFGLEASESAAEDLYTKIISDIANCGDNPYSSLYLALCNLKEGVSTTDYDDANYIDDQINELTENLKEYNRNYKDEINELMEKNGSITEFHFGKDNSKTGILFQTLNITGINQRSEDKNKTQSDTVSENKSKRFAGDVAYRMKAVTNKAEVETNIHAGSDDVDIQLAAAYKTKTKSGGYFSASLNGRETMANNQTEGSVGASVDYNKNKISAGGYYYYNRAVDEDGDTDKYSELEGYFKYDQNVKLRLGMQISDFIRYYYTNLKLYGSKDLDNSLSLSGALTAGFGINIMDFKDVTLKNEQYNYFDLGANGGLYFKTDNISASLNGRASYMYTYEPGSTPNNSSRSLNLSLLGAFATGKISVSAMIMAYKEFMKSLEESEGDGSNNSVNLSTGVGLEIKDLFNGISPQFTYTSTSIDNKVKHFFNVTLKTSLEALRKNNRNNKVTVH